jgi:hypothetical protein
MFKKIKILRTISTSVSNLFTLSAITRYSFFVLLFLLLSVAIVTTTTNVFADVDTVPPTVPTNLHISMTSPNSVSLAWNASTDNVSVAGYRVTDNGGSVDVPGLTHTFYNLIAGTHIFYVKAFDLADNLSGSSNYIVYLSLGTTGPTPSPTATNTPTPTATPTPATATFNAVRDTYVRSGQANKNDGASQFLRVQNTGSNRSIIDFSTTPYIVLQIAPSDVISAVVRVTISDNSNNWGSTGRTIDMHRLTRNWVEGNGDENSRGTGAGSTWNCAIDSNISNQSANCSGSDDWDMTQASTIWDTTATDTETITNNQTGVVEFDVTNDVKAFIGGSQNFGWIIKRTIESQSGQVDFGSRESATPPQLVITYTQ